MSKYHVAVIGSRPIKNGNRNAPFPAENRDFVASVLDRVPTADYASLSHGATDYGVDAIAEFHAMRGEIKQKQFPAYWFDPTKEKNVDRSAGLKRNEAMIRYLSDATHNKDGEFATLLVFHTTDTPNEDQSIKALLEFCAKYHPKIQVRTFKLPVSTPAPKEEQTVIDLNQSTPVAMPDPFAVPQ